MTEEKEVEKTPEEEYAELVKFQAESAADTIKLGFELRAVDEIRQDKLEKFDKLFFVGNSRPNGFTREQGDYVRSAAKAKFFVKDKTPSDNDIANMAGWQVSKIYAAVRYVLVLNKTADPNF